MIATVPFEELSFRANDDDKLPPQNIEAEEAVLGCIILDPQAMERVGDLLKPEHFYHSNHREIYKACFRLHTTGKHPNLLELANYLTDKNILLKVGGRNKLAQLVDRTVSSVNVDALAELIIEKYTRRQLIQWGNAASILGNATEYELNEVLAILGEQSEKLIYTPHIQTEKENQRHRHDRILDQLREIYTTVPEPSFRCFQLKELAQHHGYSPGFLEQLYMKSLVGECSKLLNYEELKELAGSEIREWLLHGLVPKGSTVLLAANGGEGKTKLVYQIGRHLIEGKDFGDFTATGKRKTLYYQGDESPGDMFQALEQMGYSNPKINKNVRYRFNWSCENMPVLISDINEFQPDFVMIDSLSTANKFSIYKENDMEYARPLLEIAGLAAKYGCTFLIVHHSNKEGGVRGTTAIRNAVSEVWHLDSDDSLQATPNDRILKIDKSRSRSCGVKYRLFFDNEELQFTYLGKKDEDQSQATLKESILKFFKRNPNIKFTSKEINDRIGGSWHTIRKLLGEMGAEGLVTKVTGSGKDKLYYLTRQCVDLVDHIQDHTQNTPETIDSNSFESNVSFVKGSLRDHLQESSETLTSNAVESNVLSNTGSLVGSHVESGEIVDTAIDTEKRDPGDPQFDLNSSNSPEKFVNCENEDQRITSGANPDCVVPYDVIQGSDPPCDPPCDPGGELALIDNAGLQSVTSSTKPIHSSFTQNKSRILKIKGVTGDWEVKYDFGEIYIEATITTPQKQQLYYKDFREFDEELTLKKFKNEVKDGIYGLEHRDLLQGKTFEVKVGRYEQGKGIIYKPVSGCKLVLVEVGGKFTFELPHGEGYYSTFELDKFKTEEPAQPDGEPSCQNRISTMHETALGPVQVIATKGDDQKWEFVITPPVGKRIVKTITADFPKDVPDTMKQQVVEWFQQIEKPLKVGDTVKYVGPGRPHLKGKAFTIWEISLTGVSLRSRTKQKMFVGSFDFHELALIEVNDLNNN